MVAVVLVDSVPEVDLDSDVLSVFSEEDEEAVVSSPPMLMVRPWNRNLCSLPSSVGTTLLLMLLPVFMPIVAVPDSGALMVKL